MLIKRKNEFSERLKLLKRLRLRKTRRKKRTDLERRTAEKGNGEKRRQTNQKKIMNLFTGNQLGMGK